MAPRRGESTRTWRRLRSSVVRLLGSNDELYFRLDDPRVRTLVEYASTYFGNQPVNTVRLNHVFDDTFDSSASPEIYLPLDDVIFNLDRVLKAGDIIVVTDANSNFKSEWGAYLVSFIHEVQALDLLPPEVLTMIGSYLSNQDLRALMHVSRSTATIDPSTVERRLRDCNILGKPVDYWKTFIRTGSPYVECYQYFLDKGAKLDEDDYLAFRVAIWHDYIDVAKYLLDQTSNEDEAYFMANAFYGDSLVETSRNGNLEMVKLLVSKARDPEEALDMITTTYPSPMNIAALEGHLDVVTFFYFEGLGEQKNIDEALIYAIKGGHLNVVKFLLSKGAVSGKSFYRNEDPLTVAVRFKRLDIIKYLVEEAGSSLSGTFKDALSTLNLPIIKYIVEDGYAGEQNLFTLFKAGFLMSSKSSEQMLSREFMDFRHLLEENRIDVGYLAQIETRIMSIVIYLIDQGIITSKSEATMNRSKLRKDALYFAARMGSITLVKFLLNLNLNLNFNIESSLQESISSRNLEIVRYLALRATDDSLDKVFSIVLQNPNYEVLQILIDAGVDIQLNSVRFIIEAVRTRNIELIEFLIKNGASPDIWIGEALKWADGYQDQEMIQILTGYGNK